MHATRIFMNGASQAVRLPAEYRFAKPDVCIARLGTMVVIFPKDEAWNLFESAIGEAGDDFKRPSQGAAEREAASLDPSRDQAPAPTRARIYRKKSSAVSKAPAKKQRRSA